ncbi:ribonuclease HII [bacterium]|nr:ribonuclease HII [bacterium]
MTLICGVDEAGRGPLCGPVFASAVILDDNLKIKNLDDSKKISPKKRKEIYEEIKINAFEYTFAAASVEEIDKLNILNASLLAMKRAILMLSKRPDEFFVDGLYTPKIAGCNLTSIIKGDSLIPSISAASIVAKVERDKFMEALHSFFPQYELNTHKGYPTKKHISLIKKFGVNRIYRKTFKPVKDLIKQEDA